MRLSKTDAILVAWASPASGPGWANHPVQVLVKDTRDGTLRIEWLQPDEQSSDVLMNYDYSALAAARLTRAVECMPKKAKRARVTR